MSDNQVLVLTVEQLKEFAKELALQLRNPSGEPQATERNADRRYVYGLRGIRDLFNVCHSTAQQYKNTFLAPAIRQRGRKIVIDVEHAISLYNQEVNH